MAFNLKRLIRALNIDGTDRQELMAILSGSTTAPDNYFSLDEILMGVNNPGLIRRQLTYLLNTHNGTPKDTTYYFTEDRVRRAFNFDGEERATIHSRVIVTIDPPVIVTQPSVTGLRYVDKFLYADPGSASSESETALSFQWLRDGVAISGEIASVYLQTVDDTDKTVEVMVTYTNSGGSASATSTGATTTTVAPVQATLDPANKAANMVLTEGNLIGTHNTTSGTAQGVKITQTRAAAAIPGQYFEFRPLVNMDTTGYSSVGLARTAMSNTAALGGATNSLGWAHDGAVYDDNSQIATASAWVVGTWNRVYFRNSLIWFATGNGNWNNSDTANPETGVGGISLSRLATSNPNLYVMMALVNSGESVEFNFGSQPFMYSIPSNGQALNGWVDTSSEPVSETELQAMDDHTYLIAEAAPSGVPESYNWKYYGGPNVAHRNESHPDFGTGERGRRWVGPAALGFNWPIPWGQVYKAEGATLTDDCCVEVGSLRLLTRKSGVWSLQSAASLVEGYAYREDFLDDDNVVMPYLTPPSDVRRFKLISGRNYHFWSQRTELLNPSTLDGVVIVGKSRLVSDIGANIDLDVNRVVMAVGGDYWESATASYTPDFTFHDTIVMSASQLIGTTWGNVFASTLRFSELQANPPPKALLGL